MVPRSICVNHHANKQPRATDLNRLCERLNFSKTTTFKSTKADDVTAFSFT